MSTFETRDDVLTLLVHLGYLAFDEAKDEVFIPNQEIAQEFVNAVDGKGWDGIDYNKKKKKHECIIEKYGV